MSKNITQNNIIMWLEDVVPQMQKSASPVDCLLKYAKEHNFSPAILERVGHMFNSLKTNSAYNLAKEASHRGDFISTLDVPALLEKYSSFDSDIDYDNLITNFNRWNIAEGESQTFKLASSKTKIGDVKDLCVYDHLDVKNDVIHNKLNSFYEKLDQQSKIANDNTTVKPFEKWEIAKLAGELKSFAIQNTSTANLKQIELINKFASKHLKDEFKNFDSFEFNMKNFIDDELFNESLSKFANALKSKSPVYAKWIKSANETGLDKKIKLADSSKVDQEDANIVYSFHKECEVNKLASKIYAIGENLSKYASTISSLDELKDLSSKIQALDDDIDATIMSGAVTDGRFDDRTRTYISELQKRRDHLIRIQSSIKSDLQRLEDQKQKQLKEEKLDSEKALEKQKEESRKGKEDLTTAFKSVATPTLEGAKQIAMGLTGSISDTNTSLQNLYKSVESMKNEGRVSAMHDPIKAEMDKIEAQSILQQLLFSDPVLSKLNDNEIDNLMESYNTVVNRNPSVALDKGLLRTILRQAANIQGVDANTLDTIKRI